MLLIQLKPRFQPAAWIAILSFAALPSLSWASHQDIHQDSNPTLVETPQPQPPSQLLSRRPLPELPREGTREPYGFQFAPPTTGEQRECREFRSPWKDAEAAFEMFHFNKTLEEEFNSVKDSPRRIKNGYVRLGDPKRPKLPEGWLPTSPTQPPLSPRRPPNSPDGQSSAMNSPEPQSPASPQKRRATSDKENARRQAEERAFIEALNGGKDPYNATYAEIAPIAPARRGPVSKQLKFSTQAK